MRKEYEIRAAIDMAKLAKENSANDWAKFFENVGERPAFTTDVYGVTLNCSDCNELDSFIKGLRYAIGEEGY